MENNHDNNNSLKGFISTTKSEKREKHIKNVHFSASPASVHCDVWT